MVDPGDRQARLRESVNELLGEFERRTEQLGKARQAAAALTATVRSPDGSVQATVDATGMLTELRLSPNAFDHFRPTTLARAVTDLVRRATVQVRRQRADLMRPLTEGLPDLSDLVEGAPSLTDMLPKIPDDPDPRGGARPADPDESPATWLRDDDL